MRINEGMSEENFETLVSWGSNKFSPCDQSADALAMSANLMSKLKFMKETFLKAVEKSEERKKASEIIRKGSAALRVRKGRVSQRDICIGCDDPTKAVVDQHPCFVGGLCGECKPAVLHVTENLQPGKFTALCIICGQGGTLVICDSKLCKRSYCRNCIECLISPEAYREVLKSKPWHCYLCYNYNHEKSGLIWPKQLEVISTPPKRKICSSLEYFKKKRSIDVISFNSLGKDILDKLGLPVNSYHIFYPPNDPVPSILSPGVTMLGNMNETQAPQVEAVFPVDLLIGLTLKSSLYVPKRGNLATCEIGLMFYQFYRLHSLMQHHLKGSDNQKDFFWIFVSDVYITTDEYRKIGTRFMNCDPYIMTIRLNEAYYVWSNIPKSEEIAAEISDKANISLIIPADLKHETMEKDENDILEAFLSLIVPYFHSAGE